MIASMRLLYQRMMTYFQTLHDVADFRYAKGFLNALHWMPQGHRHTPAQAGRAVAAPCRPRDGRP